MRPAVFAVDRPAKPRQRTAIAPAGHTKREALPPPPYTLLTTWAHIRVGSLVLAVEGLDDGYLPAIILSVGNEANLADRLIKVVFRDYDDYPPMTKKVTEVALIHITSTSRLP